MISTEIPTVSFLIPTFNAEKYLDRCLASISELSYPKDKIEVLVSDGGSSDKTIAIANKFGAKVLKNPKRNAEAGKSVAYNASHGEYIVFLDSDNIIASRDWLIELIAPLCNDDQIDAAESHYLISEDFTSINKYSNLLVIVDPLARLLASKPKVSRYGSYLLKTYRQNSIPVAGANGFIWRRRSIDKHISSPSVLHEMALLMSMAELKKVQIVSKRNIGIYHYYSDTLKDYIAKRNKIGSKHLRRHRENNDSWVSRQGKVRLILSVIYMLTLVGPTIEAVYQLARSRRVSWLWHPLISFLTVLIYTKKQLLIWKSNKVKI